ncbi:hypothetical protein GGF38_005750 [Coemansia sp. RSA 25]|nr:hypothetical protein GGF38_005750 [Coemansia sp. RSA 25]
MSAHPLALSNIHSLSSTTANGGGGGGSAHGRARHFHDRSRSLDLGKMDTRKGSLPLASFGTDRAGDANMSTAEPRVTESDLKIYQDYVKMRKAFDGHRDRT